MDYKGKPIILTEDFNALTDTDTSDDDDEEKDSLLKQNTPKEQTNSK